MLITREKLPVLLVVAVPRRVVVSKVALTVSLLPKLLPLIVTAVVGGPLTLESVMVAAALVAWAASRVTFRTARLSASTSSRPSPIAILRKTRERIDRPH